MKINWGTAIVLVFIGFISFIMYFVVHMNTNKKYEHDLVTEEYYKKELAFQEEIDAEKNSRALLNDVSMKKTPQGLSIQFPQEKEFQKISGVISLYRPSNKQLDFTIPITLQQNSMIIPDENMIEGKWKITIDWEYENTRYLFKKSFAY
ncbi:FixH family protein [Aquimarina sp. D1M17]|uniref:FixH family protein n=1 Tax=Aquimarina acroporae TaxID=2937283 RepID=UPI0020C15E1E|nr:FixH family protein [Aquimarina acroporae]MCK8520937.1 FixH family protein [Aquimarina acroporae]